MESQPKKFRCRLDEINPNNDFERKEKSDADLRDARNSVWANEYSLFSRPKESMYFKAGSCIFVWLLNSIEADPLSVPISVRLPQDALDALADKAFVVISWRDDGNKRGRVTPGGHDQENYAKNGIIPFMLDEAIPKFSVIIPTYNDGPYLAEDLESVFAQTFRPLLRKSFPNVYAVVFAGKSQKKFQPGLRRENRNCEANPSA